MAAAKPEVVKKILLLTADAGFGHRAAANAIAAALQERYAGVCQVDTVNPLDDPATPSVMRRMQSDYDQTVLEARELYDFGYRASDKAFPVSLVEQALIAMLGRTMRRILQAHQPDVVVTTYPLYQAPVAAVFAINRLYVPLITVVTDLAAVHSVWFSDEVDHCLVPSRQVEEKAIQAGLARECVELTGLPVNPAFAQRVDKAVLRDRLGWGKERVLVLFSGSKRVTHLEPVIDALNHSALPLEFALVAGGSDELLEKWKRTQWHQPAHVYGYVPAMHELIRAADMMVCKAGGLIVSEGLAAGLPLLIIEALADWEVGNAAYVVDGGAGELAQDPVQALASVYHWLDAGRSLLATRAANARELGHPYAAYRVAELTWQAALQGATGRERRFLAQVPLLRQLLYGDTVRTPRPRRRPT
jgi:1,2-diacylglycerol 3-beta-galactosyltransferase